MEDQEIPSDAIYLPYTRHSVPNKTNKGSGSSSTELGAVYNNSPGTAKKIKKTRAYRLVNRTQKSIPESSMHKRLTAHVYEMLLKTGVEVSSIL